MKSHKLIGYGERKLVFFPGLLGTRDALDPMLRYSDASRHQWAVGEYRGYGSLRKVAGLRTLREVVLDTVQMVEFLDWQDFTVVGHSMGGLVAQMVAVAMPRRVNAIVLLSGMGAGGACPDGRRLSTLAGGGVSREECEALVRAGTGGVYGRGVERAIVAASFADIDPQAMASYARDSLTTDIREQVRGLPHPVLELVGEHDPRRTPDMARQTTGEYYKNAVIESVPGAGHYLVHEAPLRVVSSIERFVGTLAAESAATV